MRLLLSFGMECESMIFYDISIRNLSGFEVCKQANALNTTSSTSFMRLLSPQHKHSPAPGIEHVPEIQTCLARCRNIAPLKKRDKGVRWDFIIIYTKPYSIYLRETFCCSRGSRACRNNGKGFGQRCARSI